jgi:hypothetical protein
VTIFSSPCRKPIGSNIFDPKPDLVEKISLHYTQNSKAQRNLPEMEEIAF